MARFYNRIYNEEMGLFTTLEEMKVYLHIKKVYGMYHYKEVYDPEEKISQDLGTSKEAVRMALSLLREKGLITVNNKDGKDWYRMPLMDQIEGRV